VSGVDLVTILAFVNARLDEREAAAKAATEGEWHWVDPGGKVKQALVAGTWDRQHGWRTVLPSANGDVYPSCFDAEHIALNDPAFVLADVAAKRRIVDAALRHLAVIDGEWGCCHSAEAIAAGRCPDNSPDQSEIIRQLAAPFAQHPDFDPAWAVPGEQS
jgi:hypothetical protein